MLKKYQRLGESTGYVPGKLTKNVTFKIRMSHQAKRKLFRYRNAALKANMNKGTVTKLSCVVCSGFCVLFTSKSDMYILQYQG